MTKKNEFTGDSRLLFPGKYVGFADLKGRDVNMTISHVTIESLRVQGGEDEEKPILHFEEMERRPERERKALVLNRTNTKTIQKLLGNEVNEWKGRRVTLYGTTCQAFGATVDCIRIRPQLPQQPQAGATRVDAETYNARATQADMNTHDGAY